MCLLYRNTYLFTGDHLAFGRRPDRLRAFRGACWYSWPEQRSSMERLAAHRFEWVLPGHGRPGHLPAGEMAQEMKRLLAWMATA